jgi:hypothetical protein
MIQPPKEIDEANLICFAEITNAIRPTAGTTHQVNDQILGPAKGLAICQYAGENSFYLFYCDENWKVMTDTFHLSLVDAKHQAEYEYEGISKYWKQVA